MKKRLHKEATILYHCRICNSGDRIDKPSKHVYNNAKSHAAIVPFKKHHIGTSFFIYYGD